jgi:hypothetical protein
VLGWFKQWIGYPPEAAGVLVSGGSAARRDGGDLVALGEVRQRGGNVWAARAGV